MDDERIKYYPFREDIKIIMKEYDGFANELVNKYYRGCFSQEKIKEDKELQLWVKELSAHGQGNGQVNFNKS